MPKTTDILKVSAITFALLATLWINTSKLTASSINFANHWDHHKYIYMAETPIFELRIAPFCWRILNPQIAKILPFSLEDNFKLQTFTFLWLASILLYFILIKLEFSSTLAIIGSAFFISSNWVSRFNIFDFWLTDPLAFAFTNLIILLILHNKSRLVALSLLIGVLAKESVIFTAPLIYTLNTKKILDKNLLIKSVILTTPAIIVLLAMRSYISPLNSDLSYLETILPNLRDYNPYNIRYLFNNIGLNRIINFKLYDLYQITVGTFGLTLLVLSFIALKRNIRIFFTFSPYIMLHYLSLLFAVNTERLIIAVIPVVIIMYLNGVRTLAEKYNFNSWIFITPAISTVIYLSLNPLVWSINFKYQLIILLSLGILILLTVANRYFNYLKQVS